MATPEEVAYQRLYEELGIYHNKGKGIWENKVFCLVGFEPVVESGKELIMYMLAGLVSRGATLFKYPNKKLENKIIVSADFFLCNYSLGYKSLSYDILETKLVTPIWLYTCHRDNKLYDAQLLPMFIARECFQPLMFSKEDMTLIVINDFDSRAIKNSVDVLMRFARHCGFKVEDLAYVRSNVPPQMNTYFILAQSIDHQFDSHIVSYVNRYKVPCVAIQWIMDSYMSGVIEDVKKYYVDAQFDPSTVTGNKKRRTSAIDATVAACIQYKRVICLSYAAALECDEDLRNIIRNQEIKIHVINPIHLLAPWSMEVVATRERILYNNLSLVDDSRVLLYLSTKEMVEGAFGLFSQISVLMDDHKYKSKRRFKFVRNVDIHPIKDLYLNKYAGSDHAINVPRELIAGESLVPRGLNRTFNLFDLADSIAFIGDDSILMEEEEIPVKDTYILHRLVPYMI